jgi:hypothetical protein
LRLPQADFLAQQHTFISGIVAGDASVNWRHRS